MGSEGAGQLKGGRSALSEEPRSDSFHVIPLLKVPRVVPLFFMDNCSDASTVDSGVCKDDCLDSSTVCGVDWMDECLEPSADRGWSWMDGCREPPPPTSGVDAVKKSDD